MIRQLVAIGRNTFIESIRQPIFAVLIVCGGLALALSPAVANYTLDDDNKLLIDMGFSTLFITGLFMAAFTASGVLSTDLENKTVLTLVSKPVARPVLVVGKFVGISVAMLLAYWVLAVIFLLTVRHGVLQTARDPLDGPVWVFGGLGALGAFLAATVGNYRYRKVFTSSLVIALATGMTLAGLGVLVVNNEWRVQSPGAAFQGQIMVGLLLIFEVVLILTAVAIAASTRLGRLPTLLVCLAVMMLGLLSDHFWGPSVSGAGQSVAGGVLYRVVPNLQALWPTELMGQGRPLSARYVGLAGAYCALTITAFLSLAALLFERREIR